MPHNTKELYAKVYETNGTNYGEFTGTGTAMPHRASHHSTITQKYLMQFNVSPQAKVLEIGAAFGQLNVLHPNWEGLEYSPTAVKIGQEDYTKNNPGKKLNLHEGDATALPHTTNSIDFLFTFATLEHIPAVDKAMAEIHRVVKPGGIALLAPAWNCRPWTVKKLQQRPYTELTLSEKIGKFLIPLRNNLLFRMACALPARLYREVQYALQKTPQPLAFKPLNPDFSLWDKYPHISDDDAFVNLDAHAALIYFISRDWHSTTHPTRLHRLTCRGTEVVLQKR